MNPTVAPLTAGGGPVVAGTLFDLGPLGYTQAEYALSGRAQAYSRAGDSVTPGARSPYTTRVLVIRPTDSARFNGTVWVEWLNVSAGIDAAPDWVCAHTELMRAGAAWVGVSAQRVGVVGGAGVMPGMVSPGLVGTDPDRYGSLAHPGDAYSYDIFTQAGRAARDGRGTILEDLAIERVLAVGESQSAFRLTTYVNDIDPVVHEFDGFFVHARGGTAAPLGEQDGAVDFTGDPAYFRDDLRVPVMCVEAETDLITLNYVIARQDDAEHLVTWEMAGTSHADVYTFAAGMLDTGSLPIDELAPLWLPTRDLLVGTLDHPVNAGPQHYLVNAAMAHFDRWVRDGARPPASPRLEVEGAGFAVDAHGNARGGIRTPHVDVPVAALSGLGNGPDLLGSLAGTTLEFDPSALRTLYPTKDDYLARFDAATDAAVAAGFLLAADAPEIKAVAAANYPS